MDRNQRVFEIIRNFRNLEAAALRPRLNSVSTAMSHAEPTSYSNENVEDWDFH